MAVSIAVNGAVSKRKETTGIDIDLWQTLEHPRGYVEEIAGWPAEEDKEEVFVTGLREKNLLLTRHLLERVQEERASHLTGCRKGQHYDRRRTRRNGYYYRSFLTFFGLIEELKVIRLREGSVIGYLLERYQRRSKEIDRMIQRMFLLGVSTRKVEEVLEILLGYKSISPGLVSKVSKELGVLVKEYHQRGLKDYYQYLIFDGIYVSVNSPIYKEKRCILVCYGITQFGKRELIDFEITAKGESEAAWEGFINRLYRRGLEGKQLKLAVTDGNKGTGRALDLIYPFVSRQRCWAHKMRNVSSYLPKKETLCLKEAKQIYQAQDKQKALQCFKDWSYRWREKYPKAVNCLSKDIEHLLYFYECPKFLWKKIRTTNLIERCFKEVRRRTKVMGYFQNGESVERIIFGLFNRQNAIWERSLIRGFSAQNQITHNC
jgi:transposase-like protein